MKIKLEPNDGLFLISPRRRTFGHLRGSFRRVICRLLPVAWKCGFTLLELLVVISIIGILAGFGAVSFTTAQKKGRDAKRQADMKAIQNAMEQCYSLLNYEYATSLPSSGAAFICGGATVMNSFPQDPKSTATSPIEYLTPTLETDNYSICTDLEGDGTFDGTNADFCVQNLQ